jgi:hypothetical protein
MIALITTFVLIILAGIAEGFMDTLQFHYNISIFKLRPKQNFFNPSLSWVNKYKEDLKTPRFFGSTTLFVFTTDAWHLFKFVRNIMLFIGLCIIGFLAPTVWCLIIHIIAARIVYGLTFTIAYRLSSNKKMLNL